MVNVIVIGSRKSEVFRTDRVPVDVLREHRCLPIFPASLWHEAIEVGFDSEVQVTVDSWHCNFILTLESIVTFHVIPGVSVSLTISVVSNLEGTEANEEVSGVHEKDTIARHGCCRVDAMWNLRNVVRGPS